MVLDLRTAQKIEGDQLARVITYKMVGAQATLDLALSLEESDNVMLNMTEDEEMDNDVTMVESVTHSEAVTDALNPTLIEETDSEDGGYFLIGDRATAAQKYAMSLSLVSAKHLHLAVDPNTVYQDPFYWQYNLLGVDISSEQFSSLTQSDNSFVTEKATASIRTSADTLTSFLARSSVSVKLCSGAVVIAAADLPLSCLDGAGNTEVTCHVSLVSGHNLNIGQDSEGNKPTLELSVRLVPVASSDSDNKMTTGRLEDSDMEGERDTVALAHTGHITTTPLSPPTRLSRDSKPDVSSTVTSPKKQKTTHEHEESLKSSIKPNISPQKLELSPEKATTRDMKTTSTSPMPQDVTNDLSLAMEIPTKPPQTLTCPTKPVIDQPSASHYKLSVDLLNVSVLPEKYHDKDGVLAYKV